ncbi:hypothetical protein DYB37_013635 [Aphanomyces astaci]|uniref:CS domain-containing protein n=1 Tax=Aphanomyces astaci TaxID=112090 RepID=A0A3R6YL69_APHAT|nr:hypothetical protein DYB35_010240 [Aphanomyces astaci]RHZ34671.1 hypothetical protein DYB37_013635 [Aphanomyces astaci]
MASPPSADLFVPYLYVPSEDSQHVEIVSPWGSLKVPIPLTQFYGVAIAVAAVLLSILVRFCGRSNELVDDDDDETPESVIEQTYAKKKAKKSAKKASSTPETSDDDSKAKSALEDNILRNGTNSYYYAHKPREISTEPTHVRQVISTYGWSDATKTVTIYVNHPDAGSLSKDKIHMKWTPTSLSLDITFEGEDVRSLVIPTLYAEIGDVKYKAKKDAIAFVLLKKDPQITWKSLNGAAKNIDDHIQYDDSLYD